MIPTPDRRLRVFVSSTLNELAPERAAARVAIESLRLVPVMFDLGARNHSAQRVYRDYLDQSDVFVGIYWQSYGWTAPDASISGLEDELILAAEKPRLIYIKEPAPDREARLTELIERIWASGSVATATFGSPEDLAERIAADLALLLSERFERAAGPDLPTGTVTFLFADVEDSTLLLERHGERTADLLVRFRTDADDCITGSGGTVVRSEGDGVFAVFRDAVGAVSASLALQARVSEYPDPGPLAVRMGMHTGSAAVVQGDYVGIDVHRAARIASAAHGSQIVMSAATHALLKEEGASALDLGWYRMRGVLSPEHIFQVVRPGLPKDFPPIRARPVSASRVAGPMTPVIGRERELDELTRLLAGGMRLLTLLGPGGIGKTRIAQEIAERSEESYLGEIGFVDVAPITDPELVPNAVATALGRSIEGSAPAEEVIVDELRDRKFLLILDNFEQVAAAGLFVQRLLARLPGLQVLVTSRVALRVSGEQEYPIGPLALPGENSSLRSIAAAPAVRLLVERARAVRPDLEVDEITGSSISELVRRLDGIPLAIELAAARLRILGPADLAGRIRRSIDLGTGARDLPDRQRTLGSAIDWSFQLLSGDERTLFRRLGVFVGGWDFDAAEAVAGDGTGDVAGGLESLAAHSLIVVEPLRTGELRMRMLSPVREFALARLDEARELDDALAAHAAHYRDETPHYPTSLGIGLHRWVEEIGREWGNIRQAADWCVAHGDATGIAGLLSGIWPFVFAECRYTEVEHWITALRPRIDTVEPGIRAWALYVLAFFALETGDFAPALDDATRALELARTSGDRVLEAMSLMVSATLFPAFDIDDPRIGRYVDDAIRIFRSENEIVNVGYGLGIRSSYRAARGDLAGALADAEEALSIAHHHVETLPLEAQSHVLMGFLALVIGDHPRAIGCFDRAWARLEAEPNAEVLALLLDGYGWLGLMEDRVLPAMSALGAAEGLRERLGLRLWPLAEAQSARLRQAADSVTDDLAQAARLAGRSMHPNDALVMARTEIAAAVPVGG